MNVTKRLTNTFITQGIMMLVFVALALSMIIINVQGYDNPDFNRDHLGVVALAFVTFIFFVMVCCFNRDGNFLLVALPKIYDTIHYVLPLSYIVTWAVFYSGVPIWLTYAIFAVLVAYCISVYVYCSVYVSKLSQASIMANIRNKHIRPDAQQRLIFQKFCTKKMDFLSLAAIFALMVFNAHNGNEFILISLIVCALIAILTITLPIYKYVYTSRKVKYIVLTVQLMLFCMFSTLSILMYYGVIKLPRYPEMSFNEIKVLGLVWLFSFGNTLLYPRTALSHTVKFQALLNDQPEIYEQGYNDVLL